MSVRCLKIICYGSRRAFISDEKNNVLVIEDNLATSILIRDFLKKLGYTDVITCNTGKAGIQIFSDLINAGKQPIVLLDFYLPDMNANEIMGSIFNIRPDAKIVLETADANTDENIKNALRGDISISSKAYTI